jgi:hypothetical protein
MNKYFTNDICACKTIQNRPGTFEMLRKPMIEVYLHTLMQLENILSIVFETRLDKR